ncbi:MAG: hypothetical protein ACTSRS_10445 [Candidatus Helarchaeota archaeon]
MKDLESEIKQLSSELQKVEMLIKQEDITWPYQRMDLEAFIRNYFPEADSATTIEKKFKQLSPEKFLQVIDNKLRSIDAILAPLEDRMRALEFQQRLLRYFNIFTPKKLKECRKILQRTPRGIREGFVSEKNLELAIKKGFTQKSVAELMNLWLNMRYYGALSFALSPKFLLHFLDDVDSLKSKLKNIEDTLSKLAPKVEEKQSEYSQWIRKKQRLDEERRKMTFGPENVQTLEEVLEKIHHLSVAGEITQHQAMEIVDKAKAIIEEAGKVGLREKKTLISKEKREKLKQRIKNISEKPYLFFIIAQISNLLQKGEQLQETHLNTLQKIQQVIRLLPETTKEALENEDLKKNLQIIFEPLKLVTLRSGRQSKRRKKKKQVKTKIDSIIANYEVFEQVFEDTSKWYIDRVKQEGKAGLENLLEIFNGIPLGLGTFIAKRIANKRSKIDSNKFRDWLIGFLSRRGVYELYSQLGKKPKTEAEIEVAHEIIIPPKADQRLAPLQKQIKFEFMRYLETAKINNIPIFNLLEMHQIPPIKFVETFLEQSQQTLVNIIEANSAHQLHTIVKLDPREYTVKLKTLNLKLKTFMKQIGKIFENVISPEVTNKQWDEIKILTKFRKEIEQSWITNLISIKKIEIRVEKITTSKVSALAAKLEGKTKAPIGNISPAAPPKAAAPPRAAPPSADRPAPPTAAAPPRAAPPSADRPAPPTAAAPPRATPPSADRPAPPTAAALSINHPEINTRTSTALSSSSEDLGVSEDLPSQIILEGSTLSGEEIPDFAILNKKGTTDIAVKTAKLQETIEEVIKIVEASIADVDQLSPNGLKSALQLVYQLREIEKTGISVADPVEIRKLANLAETIKRNKTSIIIQKEKLKRLQTKLNERSIKALDARLELIAKLFDEFLIELDKKLTRLSEKGTKILTHIGKRGGRDFRTKARIKKERKTLKKHINILERINQLNLEDFTHVKRAYIQFLKARKEKKNKLIKKYSEEIVMILEIDRNEFLHYTREKNLQNSLNKVFQLK